MKQVEEHVVTAAHIKIAENFSLDERTSFLQVSLLANELQDATKHHYLSSQPSMCFLTLANRKALPPYKYSHLVGE